MMERYTVKDVLAKGSYDTNKQRKLWELCEQYAKNLKVAYLLLLLSVIGIAYGGVLIMAGKTTKGIISREVMIFVCVGAIITTLYLGVFSLRRLMFSLLQGSDQSFRKAVEDMPFATLEINFNGDCQVVLTPNLRWTPFITDCRTLMKE